MHSEYQQRLYSTTSWRGALPVADSGRAAQHPRALFAVGTERDHVAPWRSVYKIHYLVDGDVTFVLTSGGHNAGIVSEPGRPRRRYRVATRHHGELCLGADEWVRGAEARQGSWWIEWAEWLAARSGERVAPPSTMGAAKRGYRPIEDAPGTYVLQR